MTADELNRAVAFGRSAFAAGLPRRPSGDTAFMAFKGHTYPPTPGSLERSCALIKAWGRGWTAAEIANYHLRKGRK